MEQGSNWSFQDIPIGKYEISTKVDALKGEIKQITNIAGQVTEEIYRVKSAQIHHGLLELGWIAPEHEQVPEQMLPDAYYIQYESLIPECSFAGFSITDLSRRDLLIALACACRFAEP